MEAESGLGLGLVVRCHVVMENDPWRSWKVMENIYGKSVGTLDDKNNSNNIIVMITNKLWFCITRLLSVITTNSAKTGRGLQVYLLVLLRWIFISCFVCYAMAFVTFSSLS